MKVTADICTGNGEPLIIIFLYLLDVERATNFIEKSNYNGQTKCDDTCCITENASQCLVLHKMSIMM